MENQQTTLGTIIKDFINETADYTTNSVKSQIYRIARHRLKKGLQHEQGKTSNIIDKLLSYRTPKYSMMDIKCGYTEEKIMLNGGTVCLGTEKKPVLAPKDPYWVGRYMEQGYKMIERSKRTGDVATALDGLLILQWLGQDERQSVKRRMNAVYQEAKNIAKKYEVPMSHRYNRKMAVLPHSINQAITWRMVQSKHSGSYTKKRLYAALMQPNKAWKISRKEKCLRP